MDTRVAVPPRAAVARQTAELRRRFPGAACWYGERSRLWLAAPVGARGLLCAPTARELAGLLAEHYRLLAMQVQAARQARAGAGGTVVRASSSRRVPDRPSVRGRREGRRTGGWLVRLGLVAGAA
ncbi:hypothetical protein [Thermomonospora cellulosilytica]|uniref:Uncharacterized protein n=1 Tax=Thermomonospora cellulosilytica TaxID=1411118 RepID=A0A7W3MV54_9ACTN|nr:hypothetical protein [Thermomonospora cellulosilytica]MBA9002451.1 hypothetical protein [Thermomonospora cellulosilytica]